MLAKQQSSFGPGNEEANPWSKEPGKTLAQFHNTSQQGHGTELPRPQSGDVKSGLMAHVLHGLGCDGLMMMMMTNIHYIYPVVNGVLALSLLLNG